MKQHFLIRSVAAAFVALSAAACTMNKQEAPPLAGPSEQVPSISVSITPDVLQQDGRSQSVVTITARGANGQPLPNLPLRAEIRVNGVPTDFGTLSARNVVTDSSGRATIVFTAPPSPPFSVDEFTVVDIVVTPIGSDFNNALPRLASVRLVPTGPIVPPAGLQPSFTVTPPTPTANDPALFDGSASQAPANNPIVRYNWNFGDGSSNTTTTPTTTHAYTQPGTFVASLTIEDGFGRTATTSQSVTVNPGVNPTARFTFSPTAPTTATDVNFNAVSSTAAPGRRIVSYTWDFGDNTSGTGVQPTPHRYTRPGTYTVTLTVTDDVGRTNSVALTVTVT